MTYQLRPEDVARNIDLTRKERGRSVRWLAEVTGVPDRTLHRRLYVKPSLLSIQEMLSITDALEVPLESVLSDTREATHITQKAS